MLILVRIMLLKHGIAPLNVEIGGQALPTLSR
jgi:hypothetical protein